MDELLDFDDPIVLKELERARILYFTVAAEVSDLDETDVEEQLYALGRDLVRWRQSGASHHDLVAYVDRCADNLRGACG